MELASNLETERLFWGVSNVDYESQFPWVMNWIEKKVPA
jgi:hypothetical protein